jgi:predicted hotdog family 3-hydroxylacyl-ACP dehydratase
LSVLTQKEWAAYIPHAGDMCLVDAVASWDEASIHAIAERHTLSTHPLRSAAGLHAVHLVEYGAQATAVHGALLALSRGDAKMRPGRLVSLRDTRLMVEYVDVSNGPLDVYAQCLSADERGAQYAFKVEQNQLALASGRVAVMYTDP